MKPQPRKSKLNLNPHKLKFMKHKYSFTINNWENFIIM